MDDSASDEYYMDEADDGKGRKRTLQVLPVADIDDDWDGEPEDGATYLALVKWVISTRNSSSTHGSRANAQLPAFTRVENPYREPSPPPPIIGIGEGQAGPSRHPALPSEAWIQSFTDRWKVYRKVSAILRVINHELTAARHGDLAHPSNAALS